MKTFLKEILSDSTDRSSLGRFGYFLTIVTTIFWVNVIFAVYVWHAYHGLTTPDMPAQIVMVILTLLGGYLGSKGADVISKMSQGNSSSTTEAKIEQDDDSCEDGPPKKISNNNK